MFVVDNRHTSVGMSTVHQDKFGGCTVCARCFGQEKDRIGVLLAGAQYRTHRHQQKRQTTTQFLHRYRNHPIILFPMRQARHTHQAKFPRTICREVRKRALDKRGDEVQGIPYSRTRAASDSIADNSWFSSSFCMLRIRLERSTNSSAVAGDWERR